MRSVEISAKTREEAIEQGLKQLGAERHEVRVEILEQGSGGFLGLGKRPWMVRVSTDSEPAHAQRHEDHRRGGPRHERGGRDQREPQREQSKDQQRPQPDRNAPRHQRDNRPQKEGSHQQERRPQHPTHGQQGDRRPSQQRQHAEKRNPQHTQQRREHPQHAPRRPEPPVEQPRPHVERAERPAPRPHTPVKPATIEQVTEAAALLETVIEKMGITAVVEVKTGDNEQPRINVKSDDSAILIGRKGQTLGSLQYLVNRMVQSADVNDMTERIHIDIEGYLDRRNTALEEMAVELAKKAKETRRRVRVRPMSAEERRVVHVCLEGDEEVRTFSVGNSPIRSIIIVPKNEIEDPNRQSRPPHAGRRNGPGQGHGAQGHSGPRHGRRPPRHARRDQQPQPPKSDEGGGVHEESES